MDSAAEPPRRITPLPDFRAMPAMSTVTFGRASYTAPTTPRGTRTWLIRTPLGSGPPRTTVPTGSGRPARVSRARASASTRASSSLRRSSMAAEVPASRPRLRSSRLAVMIAAALARRASAMWRRTASLRTRPAVASSGTA